MKKNLKIIEAEDLPGNLDAGSVYVLQPKNFSQSFYDERTDRNIGWITREEQEMLRNSVVGIAGCGGMGGLIAATLLRLGVGEIRIADCEVFDVSNLNRQFAATRKTIGQSKVFETAKMLREISDDTKLVVYPQGITEDTAEDFVRGCDVICDEIEFWAIGARILLHRMMREQGGLILNSPTVGHRVYLTKFTPDSMPIEEVLGMNYEEAKNLQEKIQTGTATKAIVRRVMNAMIRLASPEIPEYSADLVKYSTVSKIKERLFGQVRASIIATNPPMASGFLANQVLFHLLAKSDRPRNFVSPPSMPGYLMFDAGRFCCERKEGKWWTFSDTDDGRTIAIRAAILSEEREAAYRYVKEKYKNLFRTSPKESAVYITASSGTGIVGLVALDFSDETEKLPIEHIYDINRADIPDFINAQNSAQVGRWIAENSSVSLSLAYASALHALTLGKKYGWVNHTDAVHRVLTKKGIRFREVPYVQLTLSNIAEGDRAFYTQAEEAKPYIMEFEQIIVALENKLPLFDAAGIVFDDNL